MMITYKQEPYVHRYDPVFIAHLVQMKRANMGSFQPVSQQGTGAANNRSGNDQRAA